MLIIFSGTQWPFGYFLWEKNVYLFSAYFFKIKCLGVSVILDANPLSDIWFANISPILYFAIAFC